MELGDVRSAAGLACEIIGDRGPLPDDVVCKVRVLILSDGLKATDAAARIQAPATRCRDCGSRGASVLEEARCHPRLVLTNAGRRLQTGFRCP